MPPNVVMLSMWRNDHDRLLNERVRHLVSKSYHNLRWVWVVGDSTDSTETALLRVIDTAPEQYRGRITPVRFDTHIEGSDPQTRLLRLGATFNRALDEVTDHDDYVIWHESDLATPVDLVEQLLGVVHSRGGAAAGWPTLVLPTVRTVFYDTWGYRAGGDVKFTNEPPYHTVYRPDEVFSVETAGSVLLFPADEVRGPGGIRATDMAIVDLCHGLRQRGHSIWVDPTLDIVQPTVLWEPKVGWK